MKICSKCGKEFDEDNDLKTCKKCRERNRRYKGHFEERHSIKPKRKKSVDPLVLLEKEIIEYNSAHGTRYSYGQYMTRKERGWL